MKNFNIKFSFINDDMNEPLSGFDFGNVAIVGNIATFDTKLNHKSLMILPAIILLLDGLHDFSQNRSVSKFDWKTIHEDQILSFHRSSKKTISVLHNSFLIAELKESELVRTIYNQVSLFVSKIIERLQPDDTIISDLKTSIFEFQKFLKHFE